MKTCSKCKAVKPLTEFYKNKTSKDGLRQKCKVCINEYSEYMAACYKNYTEKLRERRDAYCKNDPEKRSAWDAVYRRNDPEKRSDYQSIYNKASVENLSNHYVRGFFTSGTRLKASDIPQELIELKRVQLKLHRQLRGTKNGY